MSFAVLLGRNSLPPAPAGCSSLRAVHGSLLRAAKHRDEISKADSERLEAGKKSLFMVH
jgi:hypothetical protein